MDEAGGRASFLETPGLRVTLGLARRLAAMNDPLLIEGETGVGKSGLARYVHDYGPRASSPFIVVSCPAIPDGLFEAVLLGHEAGAFTGALAARKGYARLAGNGTLFLDEIGEMDLRAQARLLHILDGGEVYPVGGERAFRVTARVIAATNRDLASMEADGRFRKDLLHRLGAGAGLRLRVPPLRERREDIPVLARHFLQRMAAEGATLPDSLSPAHRDALLAHDWPGNVRELRSILRRATVLTEGPGLSALPALLLDGTRCAPLGACDEPPSPWRRTLTTAEIAVLHELRSHGPQSRGQLARSLGRAEKTIRKAVSALLEDGRLSTEGKGRGSLVQIKEGYD